MARAGHICPGCRQPSRAGALFCGHCGEQIRLACQACGAALEADEAYCGSSGTRAPIHTPVREPPAARGERKHLTVLFADLCNSTELISDSDPEDARRFLDRVSRLMSETIGKHGGIVVHLTGDGLMALFGAPLAQEDHALRACQAALALHRALGELDGGEFARRRASLKMRVGLHAGQVVLDDEHLSLRVFGRTPHLAARMEQNAPPAGTMLSETTARLVEHAFKTKAHKPVSAKGFLSPIAVRLL
ncbi:MAG TPA: adenylate/guanylate cyclase domain-containing protein, partial [Acetobacteraceae bacterium]|nr:adenylate/guanylate cyclase domain-containing protein [Acetobacteraceae bacterium]